MASRALRALRARSARRVPPARRALASQVPLVLPVRLDPRAWAPPALPDPQVLMVFPARRALRARRVLLALLVPRGRRVQLVPPGAGRPAPPELQVRPARTAPCRVRSDRPELRARPVPRARLVRPVTMVSTGRPERMVSMEQPVQRVRPGRTAPSDRPVHRVQLARPDRPVRRAPLVTTVLTAPQGQPAPTELTARPGRPGRRAQTGPPAPPGTTAP